MTRFPLMVASALLVFSAGVSAEKPDRDGPPPGLAKQQQLPPGLQKKLERGGELPPGWRMKLQRDEVIDAELYMRGMPPSSEQSGKLPKPEQEGTRDLVIEDRVVRVLDATRTILDVFEIE